jgi:hypothetical protein
MKRKTFYQITFMGPKSWWWDDKNHRWRRSCKGSCSSHRNFGDKGKKAWREFYRRAEEGICLLKWVPNKQGKRDLITWTLSKREAQNA